MRVGDDGLDEYGRCLTCTWMNVLPSCHIEHEPGCDYLNSIYDIWFDDEEPVILYKSKLINSSLFGYCKNLLSNPLEVWF